MKKIKNNKTKDLQKQVEDFSEICKKALPVLFKFAVEPVVIPKEKQKRIKKILRH